MIKLVIVGALGRMGRRIGELATKPDFEIVRGIETVGKIIPPEKLFYRITTDSDDIQLGKVVIDFSEPQATIQYLQDAVRHKRAYVIGTTGFSSDQEKKIFDAAKTIPIVMSSNMSLGVNVFFKVAQEIAKTLPDYSVQIRETHHAKKKDAPSGTALQAGRLIEKVSRQKVTYESFREGEVVGDHQIVFKGPSDRLELFHHAESRDIFAAGALQAAKWLAMRKPGLYTMQDVLGLND